MTSTRRYIPGVVAVLLVASLAVAAVPSAGTGLPHEDGPRNQTVTPVTAEDHQPGIEDASYFRFAAPNEDPRFESLKELGYIVTRFDAGVINRCGPNDVAVAGIDVGNDDPGTQVDVEIDFGQYIENQGGTEHRTYIDFGDSDDFGEEVLSFNATDEFVAHVEDCYGNPDEPGWYQFATTINGTTYDGEHVTFRSRSHPFWICDCESEAEAREKLGPPPTEGVTPTATPESTPTPTATPSPTPTPTVTSPETTEPPTPGGSDGGAPGFGIAAAVAALLALVVSAVQRR